MLNSLGFKVVSFKKYGSICNIVLLEEDGLEDKIKSNFETILLERVPIDIEEIVMLNMMIAGKENSNENI